MLFLVQYPCRVKNVVVVYGHPYPDRSRAGRALLDAVRDLEGVRVREIYSLYPDFAIDVDAEQDALLASDVLVWQCPFYWYGMPALMHLWIEKVLAHGWAYGTGGDKMHGKTLQWVTTTGAPLAEYDAKGVHGHPFATFAPSVSQTAIFCGMKWAEPIVLHGSHQLTGDVMRATKEKYRERIRELAHESKKKEVARV